MKKGFLEMPKVYFEVFTDDLRRAISPKNYMSYPEKFPIVSVMPYFVLGGVQKRLVDYIHADTEDEERILKNVFLCFEASSFLLKKYFDFIGEIVESMIFEKNKSA